MNKASSLLAVLDRVENLAEKLDTVLCAVFGNGKPGLKSDLADLKNDIIEIRTQLKTGISILSVICAGILIPLALKYFFHIGG